jgi:hypothetical protein
VNALRRIGESRGSILCKCPTERPPLIYSWSNGLRSTRVIPGNSDTGCQQQHFCCVDPQWRYRRTFELSPVGINWPVSQYERIWKRVDAHLHVVRCRARVRREPPPPIPLAIAGPNAPGRGVPQTRFSSSCPLTPTTLKREQLANEPRRLSGEAAHVVPLGMGRRDPVHGNATALHEVRETSQIIVLPLLRNRVSIPRLRPAILVQSREFLAYYLRCRSGQCRNCRSRLPVRALITGRPPGPRMRCGWGCGAQLSLGGRTLIATSRPKLRIPRSVDFAHAFRPDRI